MELQLQKSQHVAPRKNHVSEILALQDQWIQEISKLCDELESTPLVDWPDSGMIRTRARTPWGPNTQQEPGLRYEVMGPDVVRWRVVATRPEADMPWIYGTPEEFIKHVRWDLSFWRSWFLGWCRVTFPDEYKKLQKRRKGQLPHS